MAAAVGAVVMPRGSDLQSAYAAGWTAGGFRSDVPAPARREFPGTPDFVSRKRRVGLSGRSGRAGPGRGGRGYLAAVFGATPRRVGHLRFSGIAGCCGAPA